ncbi:hypothetical protein [Pseudomonas sp. PD9R]|uniref:hypothetical protein n=1 Tax=Pseudomonas sp. PD9R TaxID=2853534 RepID=UPI001C461035|nr:hypothetical protein [Pseudomonas sp. PD9R]MBV6826661.1 hypothetical protein [Pseudomonas sp. PD9R]
MTTHEIETPDTARQWLSLPVLEQVENGVLHPSERKAVITVEPYPGMACGDKLLLTWSGLDAEGLPYKHEVTRFVSEERVGAETVFTVPGAHIAVLEGGSLELYYTLTSANLPEPARSAHLQLSVGDVRQDMLAAIADDAVGGTLDPEMVKEGTLVTIRPYPRMAAGDWILLSWAGMTPQASFNDTLKVESFSVGSELSFWVNADCIAPNRGSTVTVSYCVRQQGQALRYSEPAQLLIGSLEREPLAEPAVLETDEGILDLQDAMDGVTVVIENARTEEGELVYLKCDGEYFNYRDDREISKETAGQPLVFIVPYRFWREHRDLTVRVSFSVERLDDVSQQSEVTMVQVRS